MRTLDPHEKEGWKMARGDDQNTLPIVEFLGLEAVTLTDAERTVEAPVVLVTIRPEPQRTWQSISFPLSWRQAERLRDDLRVAPGRVSANGCPELSAASHAASGT